VSEEFKVGDEWLFVPKDVRNKPRWIKVTSVGRKWVSFTTTQTKIDQTQTGDARYRMVDKEYSSPGRIFRTKAEYLLDKHQWDIRRAFYKRVSDFHFCMELSVDQVHSCAGILGIELPSQSDSIESGGT